MSELVHRHDRDGRRVSTSTSDSDDNWKSRIYAKAEARQAEADRESGRQNLRDRIGIERPPATLRERILSKLETPKQDQGFDVIAALRAYRKERERRERVVHPS